MKVMVDVPDGAIKQALLSAQSWSASWCRSDRPLTDAMNARAQVNVWAFADGVTSVWQPGDADRFAVLRKSMFAKGLEAMAKNAPRSFAHMLEGTPDGPTGDLFLQYCLWGQVLYV